MSLPAKCGQKPRRVHLATESGGRSECRYSSRPSRRVLQKPLSEFVTLPTELQCAECAKAAAERAAANRSG